MNIRFFVNSAISSFKVFFFFYGDDKFITAQFSKFCFFWNSSLKDASHYFCGQDTCVDLSPYKFEFTRGKNKRNH